MVQYTAILIRIGATDRIPRPNWCNRQHFLSLLVHQTAVVIFIRAAVITPLYWCKLLILILHLNGAADSFPNPHWCNRQYSSSFLVHVISLLILISEVKTALLHLVGAAHRPSFPYCCSRQHSATSLMQQQLSSSSFVQQTVIFHLTGSADRNLSPHWCSN
jgi:hypothetical protein